MRPIEPITPKPMVVSPKETLIEEFHKYLEKITASLKANSPKMDFFEIVPPPTKVLDLPKPFLDRPKQASVAKESEKPKAILERPTKDKIREKPDEVNKNEEDNLNKPIQEDAYIFRTGLEPKKEEDPSIDLNPADLQLILDEEVLEDSKSEEVTNVVEDKILMEDSIIPVFFKEIIPEEIYSEENRVEVRTEVKEEKHQIITKFEASKTEEEKVLPVEVKKIVTEFLDNKIEVKPEKIEGKVEIIENKSPRNKPDLADILIADLKINSVKEVPQELTPPVLLISNLVHSNLLVSGTLIASSNVFNNNKGLEDSKTNSVLVSASVDSSKSEKKNTSKITRLQPAFESRTLKRVEQVLSEVALLKETKSLSFRLDPPSLGSVKVDISLKDGALYARIVPESSAVGNFLREQAHELVISLRKLGLNVEKVAVSIGSEGEQRPTEERATGHKKGKAKQQTNEQQQQEKELDHWVA